MRDVENTQFVKVETEPETGVKLVLSTVYEALTEKGYNPVNQIVGYIMSGDPTYITSHKSARSLIMKVERDELVEEMLELQNNVVVYRGSGGDEFLQYITSDISVDTQEADILYANYIGVTETIDTYRMSVSSVDEDEEGLDLIKFQNAYNMASKIISTMNQMFDRLITQTGV